MYNVVSGARGREGEGFRGSKRMQEEARGYQEDSKGQEGQEELEDSEGAETRRGRRLGILRIGGHGMPCLYRRVLSVSRFDFVESAHARHNQSYFASALAHL